MACNQASQPSNGQVSPTTETMPTTVHPSQLLIDPNYHSIRQQTTVGNPTAMRDDIHGNRWTPSGERKGPAKNMKCSTNRKMASGDLVEFCNSSIANVEDFVDSKMSTAANPDGQVAGATAAYKTTADDASSAAAAFDFDVSAVSENDDVFGHSTAAEELDAVIGSYLIEDADEHEVGTSHDVTITTVNESHSIPNHTTHADTSIDSGFGLQFDLLDDKYGLDLPSFGLDDIVPKQPVSQQDGQISFSSASTTLFNDSTSHSESSAISMSMGGGNKGSSVQKNTVVGTECHVGVVLVEHNGLYDNKGSTNVELAQQEISTNVESAAKVHEDEHANPFSFEEDLFAPLESFEDFMSSHGSPHSFIASSPQVQTNSSAVNQHQVSTQSISKQVVRPFSATASPPAPVSPSTTVTPSSTTRIPQPSTTTPGATRRKLSRSPVAAPTPTRTSITNKKPVWQMSPSEANTFVYGDPGIVPILQNKVASSANPNKPRKITTPPYTQHAKIPGLESPHYTSTELPGQPYITPMKGRKRGASNSSQAAVEPKRAKIQSQTSYPAQQQQHAPQMPINHNLEHGIVADYSWLLNHANGVNISIPDTVNGSGYVYAQEISTNAPPHSNGSGTNASMLDRVNGSGYAYAQDISMAAPLHSHGVAPSNSNTRGSHTTAFDPRVNSTNSTPTPTYNSAANPPRARPQPTPITNPSVSFSNPAAPMIAICSPPTPETPTPQVTATLTLTPKQWNAMKMSATHNSGMVRLRDGRRCRMVDGGRGIVCLVPVS